MRTQVTHHIDISGLSPSTQRAITEFELVVEPVREQVKVVVLAAMARDVSLETVSVRIEASRVAMMARKRIMVDIANDALRGLVEARVRSILEDAGWRTVPSGENSWVWTLDVVPRDDTTAHELAAAARLVRL